MQVCVSSTPFIHWCPRVLHVAGRVFPTWQVYTSSLPREHFRVTCCGVGCRCPAVSPSLPVRAALLPIAFRAGAILLQAAAPTQTRTRCAAPAGQPGCLRALDHRVRGCLCRPGHSSLWKPILSRAAAYPLIA